MHDTQGHTARSHLGHHQQVAGVREAGAELADRDRESLAGAAGAEAGLAQVPVRLCQPRVEAVASIAYARICDCWGVDVGRYDHVVPAKG